MENDGEDKDDNHILNGRKLSVALSESTRFYGLTIFDNKTMIKISQSCFDDKIISTYNQIIIIF